MRTERGAVRVLSPDGTLLATVDRGTILDAAAADRAAAANRGPPRRGAAAPPRPTPPREALALAPADAAARAAPRRAAGGAARGRPARALARGTPPRRGACVEPVFRLGREVAAEARAIYAESFLIEGRYADAVDGYATLVRDFPRAPRPRARSTRSRSSRASTGGSPAARDGARSGTSRAIRTAASRTRRPIAWQGCTAPAR